MSPKEIKQIAKMMHSCGIVSLKTSEIELLVQPKPIAKRARRIKNVVNDMPKNDFKGYTDEQILAWSAPLGEDS